VADAPWRCSQCGTVNEPAANACRSCGRWPSLFDLEQGAIDGENETTYGDPADTASFPEPVPSAYEPASAPEPAPVETPEPEPHRGAEPSTPDASGGQPSPAPWRGPEPAIPQLPQGTWLRRLSRVAIPIAIAIYVLISALTNR